MPLLGRAPRSCNGVCTASPSRSIRGGSSQLEITIGHRPMRTSQQAKPVNRLDYQRSRPQDTLKPPLPGKRCARLPKPQLCPHRLLTLVVCPPHSVSVMRLSLPRRFWQPFIAFCARLNPACHLHIAPHQPDVQEVAHSSGHEITNVSWVSGMCYELSFRIFVVS